MVNRTMPAGLIALGTQKIALTNSTAAGLNSTCAPASSIMFSVETNDVRYRDDGVAPALTTGVLFQKDDSYFLDGVIGANINFQRQTGSCTVNVMAYKRPGAS